MKKYLSILILILNSFFALSCATLEKNSASREISSEKMPYEHNLEELHQLLKQSNSKSSVYLNSLSLEEKIKKSEENPLSLTSGYYYCSLPKQEAKKYKESDAKFSQLLNIKNPFSYMEDPFKPEVREMAENENTYAYQSFACDEGYAKTLNGILKQARNPRVVYIWNWKENKYLFSSAQKYEGLAYNHLSFSKDGHTYENAENAQSATKSDKNEEIAPTVEGLMLANGQSLFNKRILAFFSEREVMPGPDFKYLTILHANKDIRTDSVENYNQDVESSYSEDRVKYKGMVFSYIEDSGSNLVFAAHNPRGEVEIKKIFYAYNDKPIETQTVLKLRKNQTITGLKVFDNKYIALAIIEDANARILITDFSGKEMMSQDFGGERITLYIQDEYLCFNKYDNYGNFKQYALLPGGFAETSYSAKDDGMYKSEKKTYSAAKGEKFPYFLRSRNDTKEPSFILIKFYGGFLAQMSIGFRETEKYLLDNKGIVVHPYLRGDRDMGYAGWNKGIFEGKLNTVQDIIRITEHLGKVYPKLKNKIFIEGWSNGGMLALAAVLERPELFAGVISGVPNADVVESKRLSRHDWSTEYGQMEKLNVLLKLSPYHTALSTKKHLPPILIRTAFGDFNVNPGNSFKMLAALRNNHTGGPFYLITRPVGAGHYHMTQKEGIEDYSYIYSFVLKTLKGIDK